MDPSSQGLTKSNSSSGLNLLLHQSLSEDELQRRELERLLGTAKDADRRALIRSSISALDSLSSPTSPSLSSISRNIPALNPTTHAHLFNNSRVPVELAMPSSSLLSSSASSSSLFPNSTTNRGRPMSAQMRRPSISSNLDAIPENRAIIHRTIDENDVVDLVLDDISEVSSSSSDPRLPPRNIFKSLLTPDRAGWIATGLLPQILHITFNVKWMFKRIEITCIGVDEITVTIMNANSTSRIISNDNYYNNNNNNNNYNYNYSNNGNSNNGNGNIIMKKLDKLTENLFIYDPSDGAPIFGNKVLISFNKASDVFFIVHQMKIKACQLTSK